MPGKTPRLGRIPSRGHLHQPDLGLKPNLKPFSKLISPFISVGIPPFTPETNTVRHTWKYLNSFTPKNLLDKSRLESSENNFGMNLKLTKYLKKSCELVFDPILSLKFSKTSFCYNTQKSMVVLGATGMNGLMKKQYLFD